MKCYSKSRKNNICMTIVSLLVLGCVCLSGCESTYLEDASVHIEDTSMSFEIREDLRNRDYIFEKSDCKYLDEKDISGMNAMELNYAKNEIFARLGRKFKAVELQTYFEGKSWYRGTIKPEDFDEEILNKYEKKNALFLINAGANNYIPK